MNVLERVAGKAQFRAAEAMAMNIAAELNEIADDLVMLGRENVYALENLLQGIEQHLEEIASIPQYYSKQLSRKFYEQGECEC